jgi:hypothetical protein
MQQVVTRLYYIDYLADQNRDAVFVDASHVRSPNVAPVE